MVYAGKILSSLTTKRPRTMKTSNECSENGFKRRPIAQNNPSGFKFSAVQHKHTDNYVHESDTRPVVLHTTEIVSISNVTHFGTIVVEHFVVH